MTLFCQEKRDTVDSPVMEFLTTDTSINLTVQKSKIRFGEELELKAQVVKKQDCIPISNIDVWFVIVDCKIVHFTGDNNERTDKNWVVYRRLKGGEQFGKTNVIAVAALRDGNKIFDTMKIHVQ